jgi:Protein of unknown function (DUF2974)
VQGTSVETTIRSNSWASVSFNPALQAADTRVVDIRLPDIRPTGALSVGLRTPTILENLTAQTPLVEARAYRQSEPSVKFAITAGQSAAVAAPSLLQSRDLALLSADVYRDTPNPPAGYRVAVEGDLGKLGLKPSDLTSTQSPFRARVYVRGAGADTQYIVAFRGSTSGADWASNIRQSVGLSSDHYRRALYVGSKLALATDANVVITGHSLGGGLASAAAVASGRPAATFNSAGLSDATLNAARAIHDGAGVRTADNVSAYYVRGEILSALQDGGDRVIGGLIGGLIGGIAGGRFVDAPEAYGNRIGLQSVRPDGLRWYQDNAVARHGIDWVLASLNR